MAYQFITPTEEEAPAGGGSLFARFRLTKGISVFRLNGVWLQTRYPSVEQELHSDVFYRGGYKHPLTAQARTDLINAGYGAYIVSV